MAHQVDQRDALVGGGGGAGRARAANRSHRHVQRGGQQAERLGEWPLRKKRQRRAVQLLGGGVELLDERVLKRRVRAGVAARQPLDGDVGQPLGGQVLAQQLGNCVGLLVRHQLEIKPRRRRRGDERNIAHRLDNQAGDVAGRQRGLGAHQRGFLQVEQEARQLPGALAGRFIHLQLAHRLVFGAARPLDILVEAFDQHLFLVALDLAERPHKLPQRVDDAGGQAGRQRLVGPAGVQAQLQQALRASVAERPVLGVALAAGGEACVGGKRAARGGQRRRQARAARQRLALGQKHHAAGQLALGFQQRGDRAQVRGQRAFALGHAAAKQQPFALGKLEWLVVPGPPRAGRRGVVVVVEQQREGRAAGAPADHNRRAIRRQRRYVKPVGAHQRGHPRSRLGKRIDLAGAGRHAKQLGKIAQQALGRDQGGFGHGPLQYGRNCGHYSTARPQTGAVFRLLRARASARRHGAYYGRAGRRAAALQRRTLPLIRACGPAGRRAA